MADKLNKTTSSISSSNTTKASPARPNSREADLMTKLAEHISDNYRMVKQRQQKFYDLTNQMKGQEEHSAAGRLKGKCAPPEEWQEVYSPKNKLKRKKTLSTSLTSVTDSVNQEKRTRIEGIQLNCRGKLILKENQSVANEQGSVPPRGNAAGKQEKLAAKPPLPPHTPNKTMPSETNAPKVVAAPPPPRLKRKLQENVQTIQKLNALAEQLRLEINELKSNLTTERGAVRVLRAQNEAETRKWKTEVKKLQNVVEHLKKNGASRKSETNSTSNAEILPQAAAVGGLVNYEIQRLTNEVNALKEANKALEEKKVLEEIKTKERNIGQLKKDLQTLQNSKNTSRNATTTNQNNSTNKTTTLNLNKKPKNSNNNSNNNNNNVNNNNKNTTTDNNANQAAPASSCGNDAGIAKSPQPTKQQEPQSNQQKSPNPGDDDSAAVAAENKEELSKQTNKTNQEETSSKEKIENSNEISKLKNIELINNTKNVTTNLQRSTKILTTRDNDKNADDHNDENATIRAPNLCTSLKSIHQQLKALDIPEVHNDCMNLLNENGQFATLLTTTKVTSNNKNTHPSATTINNTTIDNLITPPSPATMSANGVNIGNGKMTAPAAIAHDVSTHRLEEHHLSQELTQHLNTKAIEEAKQTDLHNHSHSDSDSALSSAPPSISPQPPANGVEPTDIWQTIRCYSSDIEKLQKEVDSLQKENEKLRQELNVAKDQIIDLEGAALEHNANNEKHQQLLERIKCLEETENDLREQNELLEFRILELEDNASDKWSLQTNPSSEVPQGNQNVWACSADRSQPKPDPFEMLFGSNSHTSTMSSVQLDSGIISPQSQGLHDDLIDITNEELCRRLGDLLKKNSLEEEEKHCLQQVLNLVQQLDALTPRSGPNSLLANTSSEEATSMDMVKSRISEYSSTSSSPLSSLRSCNEKNSNSSISKSASTSGAATPRIVATVQPYNSSAGYSHGPSSQQTVPHNTPTDSPRKTRPQHWHNNSLSESGVFVESDFLSDSGDNTVCTQTDFEDCSSPSGPPGPYSHHLLCSPTKNVPAHLNQNQPHHLHHPPSPNLSDQKRLQYYKDRLNLLEGKVLIYESSGDVQAKRLAERLQREILLEKEVKELRDRVEFLESENCTLEEEKCEFEEAENDTRLRLQRLEIELEILSQRNIELEMSREALSAKYKDCHSECLILRDDLSTSETHVRHLEEDKQKAKENFEFLHNLLPVLLVCNTAACTWSQTQESRQQIVCGKADMCTSISGLDLAASLNRLPQSPVRETAANSSVCNSEICKCLEREVQHLKEEVKCLRHQIKELNSRHYAAMESADSHWVDLEREYKEREEQFQAKEQSLKQKIQKLQDCLKEDARSANEKICQLEETEQGLKTCLVKVSKEHQKLLEDHQCLVSEFERFKEQHDQLREQQKPLTEGLEMEKKRNKGLMDELTFMRKLQQETELQTKHELDGIRNEMFDLRKEYLHIEVTNGELREEVATLELQVDTLQKSHRDSEEKVRCLTDEIRTKDEICQKLEKRLERSEGYSLADELGDTPTKRFKREEIKDLKTASKGLGSALRHMSECEKMLPTQKQFQTVARDVKKLADTLLNGETSDEEKAQRPPKLILTEITRI
ncbi:ras guanine nucleotide exchange factor R isoform X2 [Stomoxys calcitrans]|uniref:ras guanine nucleotide exchange factor R isoform X2 n=1 Tax=Stomoxys calcitrans TaxID=35570 RepID=UPI0027E22636|nr:ras guanine nucleotide exchange factor R isoform X2 [Stomoxys calcitrans]